MLPLHSSEYSEEKEASENLLSDSCENGSLEERESNRSGGARVYWAIGLLATSNVITILLLIILRQGTSLKPGTASVFPNAEYESVMFQKDERFVKPPSIESNAAWQAAIPGFVGLMYINDSQHFGLPEGRYASDGTPNVYGVSWTHQYHCLNMMRLEFWKMVRNSSNLIGIEDAGSMNETVLPHILHCYDYIRQTILCDMDTTIEWPTGPFDDEGNRGIDGYEIAHTCKKKDGIIDFMNLHKVKVDG